MAEKLKTILGGVPLSQSERGVLIENAKLGSAGLKLALATLSSFMGNGEGCWPSLHALAQRMCCDVATAKRRIGRLKRDGFLTSKRRTRPDGGWTSTAYEIVWERLLAVQVDDFYNRTPLGAKCAKPPLAHNAPSPLGAQCANLGAGCAKPTDRQTVVLEEKRGDSSGESAVCLSVPEELEESSEQTPKLLHPAEKLRRITRAAAALKTAGVWPNVISDLLREAEDETGDPLPRVLAVLEAAQRGKFTAKWIRAAIEDRWELSERQLSRAQQDIEERRAQARAM